MVGGGGGGGVGGGKGGEWCIVWYNTSNLNRETENSSQTKDFELLKLREDLVKLRDRYER